MNIANMTAADLPGIDEAKFGELKARGKQVLGLQMIGIAILVVGYLIGRMLIGGGIGYLIPVVAYFAFLIAVIYPNNRRMRELQKELKLAERLAAKRKGEVFKG